MNKERRFPIKGTNVCLIVMYVGWIWYIHYDADYYVENGVWLNDWLTWGTIALFLIETLFLYRLKRLDEGKTEKKGIFDKGKGWITEKVPAASKILDATGLEDDINEQNEINLKKEAESGKQTDE